MTSYTLFLHRASDNNVGDRLCSPYSYFRTSHPRSLKLEVHLPGLGYRGRMKRRALGLLRDRAEAIVIGGGGLLGNDYFREDILFWTDGPAPSVLWGAGHNSHDPLSAAKKFPDETGYPELVRFASIGLRDWGPGFTWVPCVSCMHPAFSLRPQNRSSSTLFVMHRDLRDMPDQVTKLLGRAPKTAEIVYNDSEPDVVLGKIGSAAEVVTNSFHAAYWATLMRTPVVVIGGGTKVGLLKHPVPIGDHASWPELMVSAPIYPTALEECRDRNSDFNAHVEKNFTGRSSRRFARSRRSAPVEERQADFAVARQSLPRAAAGKVPKIIHFVFGLSPDFGGKPFNIMHLVAVRSVVERCKPEEVFFHHEFEPNNEMFEQVRSLLTLHSVKAPTEYRGHALAHFAHRADVLRMQILRESGGIYLDLDTVSVSSLDSVLTSSFTIGLQGKRTDGLCNAVMAASPGDPFVVEWLRKYDDFSPDDWDRFSVKVPYLMWRSGKASVNVLPYDAFHWPTWDSEGLRLMFEEQHSFDNALLHHLWESKSFPKYFANESLSDATLRLKRMKSTYSRLASPYI